MESNLEEILKSAIMVFVTLSIIIAGFITLWLLRKSKTNADDVTAPLVTSIFTSGLVMGLVCMLACIINWSDLQQHPAVLYLYIYLLVVGFYMNFKFVAILASLKLFAVLKPFLYKRTVTFRILKNICITIWVCVLCVISPIVTYFSLPTYNPVMKTVMMTDPNILVFSKFVLYFTSIILILTSMCFFIAVVRHRIKMKGKVAPLAQEGTEQQRHQRKQAGLSAIWAYKGVLILSMTRIALNLPFYIMLELRLRMNNSAFYAVWAILSIFVWDAVGYVLFTKKLRQLVSKGLKCNRNKNKSGSARITIQVI